MEDNTFATSAFIQTDTETAFDYLCELKNLDDWTLFSRMIKQVDPDTWIGTASGYQHDLYYHVKKFNNDQFRGIEWHCGREYQQYFQVYPVFLFPSSYVEPGSGEQGVYFHWLSFVDPKRRTPMIMQGIETVHTSECRSLKGIMERNNGLSEAAVGRYKIDTYSIFVDAPLEIGERYITDLSNLDDWAHLLRQQGELTQDENGGKGEFLDEYNQRVSVEVRSHKLNQFYLIEQDFHYPDHNFIQRSPMVIIPCSVAFGDDKARGFILHRITFWPQDKPLRHGKLQIQDFGAESMNIKRLLEAEAGNLETFSKGMSYRQEYTTANSIEGAEPKPIAVSV